VSGANGGTVAIGVGADLANQTTDTGGIPTLTADTSADSFTGAGTSAAQQAMIQENSRILANSTAAGNGGRVVVWSEHQSTVGGTIEAKGGDAGGDGGLVETSGRSGLTIIPGTKVNTAAPKGKAGTWLLDPAGITVDNTVSDTANGSSPPFDQNAISNHVKASDITDALALGNVTITTTNAFDPNTDIVVDGNINIPTALGGNHTLALNSAGGITINYSVGGAGSDVIFQAQAAGDISIASGASVLMNGISLYSFNGEVNVSDLAYATNDKSIFLTAQAGNVNVTSTGQVIVTDNGTINFGAGGLVSIAGQVSGQAASKITLISTGSGISFSGSGQVSTLPSGSVYFDTHFSSSAGITGASSAAVSSGSLDIFSGRMGVASTLSPLVVSVDNFIATVASNNQTTGGGVFIKNVSSGTLHLGGVTPLSGQPGGILIPILAGFGGVEINNTAGDIRIDSINNEHVAVPGNIKLTAGGANSDIQILNTNPNSVVSHFGSVTLNAGRNVQIGDQSTNIGAIHVRGQTNVDVLAGGDITVAGSLLKAGGTSGLSVTAGGDINIVNSNGFAAIIGTSGGAAINLTTGAGGTFNNDALSTGGVLATLKDDVTNAAATGAAIRITADHVVLDAPLKSGSGNSYVSIGPVTATLAFDIGTKNAGNLSFSPAEMNQIFSPSLVIGAFSATGDLVVSQPILAPPGHFPNLTLVTGGNISINKAISLPSGLLAVGSGGALTIAGNLSAKTLNLIAGTGGIDASSVSVITSHLLFSAYGGGAMFTNAGNAIAAINTDPLYDISTAQNISIRTNGSLIVNGQLGTTGVTDSIFLGPTANLTLASGAQLVAANFIQLDVTDGSLINNAGASVLNAPKYAVWQLNYNSPLNHEGGIPGTRDTTDNVQFPFDPLAPDPQVFYYYNPPPPPPPPPAVITQRSLALTVPKEFVLNLPPRYQEVLSAPNPAEGLDNLSLGEL
jgi:hypothetical protein